MSNNSNWLDVFIKKFDLEKYSSSIKCDGISIIKILHKKKALKNNKKITDFIESGNFNKFLNSKNRSKYLNERKKSFLSKSNSELFKDSKKKILIIPRYVNKTGSPSSPINFPFKKRSFLPSVEDPESPPRSPCSPPVLPSPPSRGNRSKSPLVPKMRNDKFSLRAAQNRSKNENKEKLLQIKKNVEKKFLANYKTKIWIAFGVNDYQNLNKLSNAVNDAQMITDFVSDLGFTTSVYLNKEVTKHKIEHIIKSELYKSSHENDLLVISFHGHGVTLDINNREYGFIAPYDAPKIKTPANLVSMEDLSNWTKYLKNNHILLFMDCCFSGFTALRSDDTIRRKSSLTEYSLDKYLNTKSRIVINAGTHDQKVADGGWNDNSIFTGAFMSFPGFQNNIGSVSSLYNYLLETVPKYHAQTPTMGKLIGDQGGDIFLSL